MGHHYDRVCRLRVLYDELAKSSLDILSDSHFTSHDCFPIFHAKRQAGLSELTNPSYYSRRDGIGVVWTKKTDSRNKERPTITQELDCIHHLQHVRLSEFLRCLHRAKST